MAALLGFALIPFAGVANADHGVPLDPVAEGACPEDPPDAFTDDETSVHEDNINCIAFWEITVGGPQGLPATQYGPALPTTRGQMASFIARFIDTAEEGGGTALPDSGPDAFTDDEDSVHEDNINRLAAAGVVSGTSATTYNPEANVDRAQMATFIRQAIDYVDDGDIDDSNPPAADNDHFTDDDASVHEDNINALAEAHIVVGTGGGEFNPEADVRRDQMASFIAQGAAFLAGLNLWPSPPGADVTVRPELVSARIVKTTTPGQVTPGPLNQAGTVVEYTFDEPVTGSTPAVGSFHVYEADGDCDDGTAPPCPGGVAAQLVSGDNTKVQVLFDGAYDSAAEAATLTVATVDVGAVSGSAGLATDSNVIGDAAIGSGSQQTLQAGVTAAPDLVSVGNFRQGSTADVTAVDFTFDEAAHITASGQGSGFHLVLQNGVDTMCLGPAPSSATPSGGTVPGGNGTTVITVVCDEEAGSALLGTGNVARGVVETSAVGDAAGGTGNLNPLQAADVGNSGNSVDPDLVSAIFLPDSVAGFDNVLYVFDESVQSGGITPGAFRVYHAASGETAAIAASRSSQNSAQVLATFADGTLSTAVGASVEDGAVTELDGANVNEEDEVAVTPPAGTATPAGRTDGPDLIGVEIFPFDDLFNPPSARARFIFDEDVNDAGIDLSKFFLYLADGQTLTCTAQSPTDPTTRAEDVDHTIVCSAFGTATRQQVLDAVLGAVDDGAVDDEATGSNLNPEGSEPTQSTSS